MHCAGILAEALLAGANDSVLLGIVIQHSGGEFSPKFDDVFEVV